MKIKINFTIVAVFAVGLLATSGDITMTWSSPIYPKLYSNDTSINPLEKPISETEDAWIGSLINIGAIIGPLPFSFVADKFGRKVGLLCTGIPHIIAYITFAFAKNVYLFYFGRFFGGLAVGSGYALLPMYLAEISEDSNRGLLSVSLALFWAFGNLLPYVLGPFMSIMAFNLILACFPVSFFILFMLFGIETPYYWLRINNHEKAEESLMKLRSLDKKGIEKELNHIKENLKREEGGHFLDIIKNRGLRKALAISLFLIVMQQFSGINGITFYLQPIFDAAETNLSSDISSLIIGLVFFVAGFIAPLLVNRFGRRTLTVASCIGIFLTLSIMGVYFYLHDSTDIDTGPISWIPIFSLIAYILAFDSGFSVMPWTIPSELFPTNVKRISASAVSSACWTSSFLITQLFNSMNHLMGRAGTFWFYAGSGLVAAIFAIFFVPETKGKSFREIQDMLGA